MKADFDVWQTLEISDTASIRDSGSRSRNVVIGFISTSILASIVFIHSVMSVPPAIR